MRDNTGREGARQSGPCARTSTAGEVAWVVASSPALARVRVWRPVCEHVGRGSGGIRVWYPVRTERPRARGGEERMVVEEGLPDGRRRRHAREGEGEACSRVDKVSERQERKGKKKKITAGYWRTGSRCASRMCRTAGAHEMSFASSSWRALSRPCPRLPLANVFMGAPAVLWVPLAHRNDVRQR